MMAQDCSKFIGRIPQVSTYSLEIKSKNLCLYIPLPNVIHGITTFYPVHFDDQVHIHRYLSPDYSPNDKLLAF